VTLQKKTDNKTTKKLSPEADLVRRFMRYLKLDRNYSVNTQEAYSHDLRYFMRFLHEHGLSPLEVKLEDLEQFAASLHEFNLGARSQSRILFGVRSFYRYLTLDGFLEVDPTELLESPILPKHLPTYLSTEEVDPTELLESPILPKHLPTYLSTEEVDRLEDSIDLETNEGQRNRAIIETLFSCGLRVSELTNLKLSDLNLDEHFIRVIGKGDKERLVPISDRAIHELQLWFEDRKEMKIKPGEEDYVFLNRRGHHLTRVMILIMIKRQALAAGIKKTISPHTLRHSFATAMLKGGADLRVIQVLLGHANIGTTEIYTHLDDESLRKEILEHHPRNRKVRS